MTRSREHAAARMLAVLDAPFLRALSEAARLEILRVMLLHGPGDVGSIAAHLPQDRSVVSRHLAVLERAGIVQVARDGRRRVYAIDGAAFVRTLEAILGETRAMVDLCCPPVTPRPRPSPPTAAPRRRPPAATST